MKHLIVIYSKDDEDAVADHNVDNWLIDVINSDDEFVRVATCVQLIALRLAHQQELLSIENIEYGDTSIGCKTNGRLTHWPNGFFDEYDILLDKFLGIRE